MGTFGQEDETQPVDLRWENHWGILTATGGFSHVESEKISLFEVQSCTLNIAATFS